GVAIVIQDTRNYKEVTDLLGGEFYVDWDKFAQQDFPGDNTALQNDLRRPNRIVRVGDQVGYDYYSRIRQQSGWLAYSLETNKWEVSVAGAAKAHSFFREGLTQNGKFPDNSFGESDKHLFFLPSGKGLLRYKLDGRNYLSVSGIVSENAPTFRNSFISPRTRNTVVNGLETEKLQSGEARYDYKSPYLKFSLAGYYTTTKDGIESTSFYHDDLRTFANFTLTNIDRRYSGVEGAVQYTLVPGLTGSAAASVGQYIYTSRPIATLTRDNSGTLLQENRTIYAKNFFVAETTQRAYTVGLTYKNKSFWTFYLNVNRFEKNYIDFNPIRRTEAAIEFLEVGSEQWNEIIFQEEVDPAWTVDLSINKSWKPKMWDGSTLLLNVGITNLLNNTDYINGGFEQYRFDLASKDINTFPTKYSYMEGLNYFLQLGLRF
ncbi:MAG: TonB-dependent receptor, partial [Bacteroidota bacterium]|nr:TonB-dependent receptor [Bacteroidota bacterium]